MHTRLKELRKALGLKLREISDALGISISSYADFEHGRIPIPKVRIYQICKEFNVNRDWLEHGTGDMFDRDEKQDREEEIQERFVLDVFSRLTSDQQKRIISALRKFLDISAGVSGVSDGSANVQISNSSNIIGNVFNNGISGDKNQ